MESATEILRVEEEDSTTQQKKKTKEDLALKKALLALSCCFVCAFVQGVSVVCLLIGNHRSTTWEANSSVQVPNESLPESSSFQVTGWSAKSNEEKPRAHLTGTTEQDYSDGNGALQWEDHLGLAFLKNGMKYVNKMLEIPQSGDYFVYAQVTFHVHALDCTSLKKKLKTSEYITQNITKSTDGYPVPDTLLSGSKYLCEMKGDWYTAIYLGAVFNMEQGDRLMVNVNNIALVDGTGEHRTYFGAFLL